VSRRNFAFLSLFAALSLVPLIFAIRALNDSYLRIGVFGIDAYGTYQTGWRYLHTDAERAGAWAVLAASALLPALWLGCVVLIATPIAARRVTRGRRRSRGLCLECGYDLRATPQGVRCPECGNIAAN
jgi:hypothetical protein